MRFGLKPYSIIGRYTPALKDGVSIYCTITTPFKAEINYPGIYARGLKSINTPAPSPLFSGFKDGVSIHSAITPPFKAGVKRQASRKGL